MNPNNWFLIAIIILFLDFFVRSFYFLPVALGAFLVGFISLQFYNFDNIYLEVALFLALGLLLNSFLQFPRKWIKIFALKMRGYDIDHQIVRTITVLKEGEVGQARWSGVIVDVMLVKDNIDKEIPADSSMRVVKLNRSTFIVTNNHY